jgi:hypothetical protein
VEPLESRRIVDSIGRAFCHEVALWPGVVAR